MVERARGRIDQLVASLQRQTLRFDGSHLIILLQVRQGGAIWPPIYIKLAKGRPEWTEATRKGVAFSKHALQHNLSLIAQNVAESQGPSR
jgi:hypothetical protein